MDGAAPRREAIRRRLGEALASAPAFDAGRFTRGLEAAYEAMWSRELRGLAPEHLRVSS